MVKQQLVEWRDLQKLEIFNRAPVLRKATQGPDLRMCADLLEGVFKSDVGVHISEEAYEPIDYCTSDEVLDILKHMRKKKASDRNGMIMEMFLLGGQPIWDYLAHFFNQIILTGSIPDGWRESFFVLLHKGGATNDANNWRPIAILRITYKIFARLLHSRIKDTLEAAQSDEQYGFRPGRSTTDALLIAETIVSRSLEYNFDVWMISIDLRKAFDRVEQDALFLALEAQGVSSSYRYLLQQIYKDQIGVLSDDISFGIDRGVRQGDILSPILFNSVLEKALADWKMKIKSCGFYLKESFNQEPLTNIRFADDLLVFGKTLEEAVYMLECLVASFSNFGLELNVKKTKMFSTSVVTNDTVLVDTAAGPIELLSADSTHKYLGRAWSGDLRNRGLIATRHRLACAWGKFASLKKTLLNKHINLGLRLKLFSSCVTPALLYSLETCPLTHVSLNKLDCAQRRMLRSIVGWVSFDNDEESWESRGHRMKAKLRAALELFPVTPWSELIAKKKQALYEHLSLRTTSDLVKRVVNWKPRDCEAYNEHFARKAAGHPRCTWEDF